MTKPEPTEVVTRFLGLKGSKDTAEMKTTDGETRLNSVGTGSLQSDWADALAPIKVVIIAITMILVNRFFMVLPPAVHNRQQLI
jgi:hypothetical protein